MSAVMGDQALSLPPGPIGGPAAWTGPALDAQRDWIHHFSSAELDEIDAAVRQHVAGRLAQSG
ncbi:MAG: hypothetical protein ACKODB_06085 [Betaproteobacteria bacterium]